MSGRHGDVSGGFYVPFPLFFSMPPEYSWRFHDR